MALPPERKIIIVDGVTNAGKTTAVNILRKQMPGCTQVKFSDYYHKSVQRALGKVSLNFSLSRDEINEVVTANCKRYQKLLSMVKESPFDDYLIERLHPTDYVYQKQLFGYVNTEYFKSIDDALNELGASLIVLTIDDETLKQRMEETLAHRNRQRGAGFEIPQHILSYDSNKEKRDLYLEFFEKCSVEKKRLVDTSKACKLTISNYYI